MNLASYWEAYQATLATIRKRMPATVDQVVEILNSFEDPSSGIAFFPSGADDTLSDAIFDAGWHIRYIEGDYVWQATNALTGQTFHYVEGDIYRGPWVEPTELSTTDSEES